MSFIKIPHTKKSLSFLSIVLFLQTPFMTNAQMSEKAVISTYQSTNGPWQNLEYLFVIKPENELNRFIERSFAALGIIGAGMLTKYFIFDGSDSKQTVFSKNSQIKNIIVVLSSLSTGKALYNFITSQAKRNIQEKTLLNFLKQWDLYRLHMPSSLIEYFDELALQYQAKGKELLTSELIYEVFELVQHHIEHHFEARYKKGEPKALTNIETFKNCIEMWKNLG